MNSVSCRPVPPGLLLLPHAGLCERVGLLRAALTHAPGDRGVQAVLLPGPVQGLPLPGGHEGGLPDRQPSQAGRGQIHNCSLT